jgi:phenylpropionate dioxygenase-like ring-hydroxylating dioxygenase large terminal subunit
VLTREENELLTRTGPGTPMGELFRRYWLPVMLSEELPAPDCPPVKVKVLGEQLVAFRDSNGRVGLLDAYCPHRNANLYWGRNEECGIRCVYHGWKFDVEGNCVDMPNEPAESRFKEKVHQRAYRTIDRGGVIWAYMGPVEQIPELPELEWTRVPADQRYVTKRFQRCNYLQNVEGEVDSSHISFLHSRLDTTRYTGSSAGAVSGFAVTDRAPVFHLEETDYGLLIGARRNADESSYYWRITQFLMPTYTMIPAEPGGTISFTGAVPVDDDTMVGFTVTWHPDRPLTDEEIARIESWTGIHTEVDERYQPVRNMDNEYLIDRRLQRTGNYTGIRGIREQDLAVQEDQRGPISDRSIEHLGTSDLAIIAMRRRLLRAARQLQEGIVPAEAHNGSAYRVRSAAIVLQRDADWVEGARDVLIARV